MTLPGEFDLIERYFAPLSSTGSFRLKDDAALVDPPGTEQLVVTHDTILQGIHFLDGDPPFAIAQKALRVNLSDIFAKGASPIGYTLSLGVPDGWDEHEIRDFSVGLEKDQSFFNLTRFSYADPVTDFQIIDMGSFIGRILHHEVESGVESDSVGESNDTEQ